jgi:hypothetical protein
MSFEHLRIGGKYCPFLFCGACGTRVKTLEDGQVRWPVYAVEKVSFVHLWCTDLYEAMLSAEYGDDEDGIVVGWSDLDDFLGCLLANLDCEDAARLLTKDGGRGAD